MSGTPGRGHSLFRRLCGVLQGGPGSLLTPASPRTPEFHVTSVQRVPEAAGGEVTRERSFSLGSQAHGHCHVHVAHSFCE